MMADLWDVGDELEFNVLVVPDQADEESITEMEKL